MRKVALLLLVRRIRRTVCIHLLWVRSLVQHNPFLVILFKWKLLVHSIDWSVFFKWKLLQYNLLVTKEKRVLTGSDQSVHSIDWSVFLTILNPSKTSLENFAFQSNDWSTVCVQCTYTISAWYVVCFRIQIKELHTSSQLLNYMLKIFEWLLVVYKTHEPKIKTIISNNINIFLIWII